MGGSKPSPPTIIMPAEQSSTAYQTLIPKKSYKDLAQTTRRMEKEINRITSQRYDEVGTPAEIGARQRGLEMQESASYLSSLPRGGSPDTGFKETPRAFPIKSNNRGTFDTVAGSMAGYGGTRPGTGAQPSTGLDPAREAASVRFEKSKEAYAKGLNRAKTTPRSFMPVTPKNIGYADNPDKLFNPKTINNNNKKKKKKKK